MHFPHLDARTRTLMLEEVAYDVARDKLYISPRLTQQGAADFLKNLEDACREGNEQLLALRLRQPGQMLQMEQRGMGFAKVPHNAAELLAEGEFNRFYMRALCLRALEEGVEELLVIRAKYVENPRPESEAKIGSVVVPDRLLKDLRDNVGVNTALGLPAGPNSGLSVGMPPPLGTHRAPNGHS